MVPTILNEQSVRRFCFYLDGRLYEGLTYAGHLFRLYKTIDTQDRSDVSQLCARLTQANCRVVVTTSHQFYKIWLDLHTPTPHDLAAAPFSVSTTPAV